MTAGGATRIWRWPTRWTLRVVAAVVVVAVVILILVFRASPTRGSRVGVVTTKAYGAVLVVKGGVLAGFPLYEFSGDVGRHLGCGTTQAAGYDLDPNAKLEMSCTGPMSDMVRDIASDDWPAFTTTSRPVAGSGVNQKLLGTIHRRGIGTQVTYGGHPLYLFDPPLAPFRPLGEDYLETVSPLAPWHGYWSLVSSKYGASDPGVAAIEAGTLANGHRVVAVEQDPNINPLAVTVYSYSGGVCSATCAPEWVPVLTTSAPTEHELSAKRVGVVHLADGALQVTYDGKPLYEYSREKVSLTRNGSLLAAGTAGNGNGLSGPGGTFSVVPISPSN
ncbi:MAG: hypothetical protein ACRDVC_00445 [Acidimicrobiales bacterium]